MCNFYDEIRNRQQKGMTLLEVLISLVIIALAATTFLPLTVYVSQSIHRNQIKMAANSLAESVMEGIKALPYEDRDKITGLILTQTDPITGLIESQTAQIGTIGGNPPGQIPQTQTQPVGGTNYTVETMITWGTDGSNYTAYKKIEIIVSAPSLPGKASTQQAKIQSLMAREGEVSIVPGGNLLVCAVCNNILQKDAKVTITRVDTGVVTTGDTDEIKGVYFAELPVSVNYNIDMDPTHIYMMTQPISIVGQNWYSTKTGMVPSTTNVISPINFEVDYPVRLSLQMRDADGQTVDKTSLWAEIIPAVGSLQGTTTSIVMTVTDLENFKLWPRWTYDLKLKTSQGGAAFYTRSTATTYASDSTMLCWDGILASSSAPVTLVKTLTIKAGKPAVVSLSDQGDGNYKLVLTAKPNGATIYYSYTTNGTDPVTPATAYKPADQNIILGVTSDVTLKIKAQAKQTTVLMDSDVMVYTFTAP
jgi:prepilin-type N-terminal cleavage/methylation domain-containing protein